MMLNYYEIFLIRSALAGQKTILERLAANESFDQSTRDGFAQQAAEIPALLEKMQTMQKMA